MAEPLKHAGNSTANVSANPSADVDWARLHKPVTYQLLSPISGWIPITRVTYALCINPATRRILLRDEQKIINSTLLDTQV